jgi:hypothetical protein
VALASAGATNPPGMLLPGRAHIRYKQSGLGDVFPTAGATICARTTVESDLVCDKSQCCGSTLFATRMGSNFNSCHVRSLFPGSYPDGSFSESS